MLLRVSVEPKKMELFCVSLVIIFLFYLICSSVLSDNLEGHMKRCPLLKQAQSLSGQPFYQKGINGGKDDEDEEDEKGALAPTLASSEDTASVTSAMKRNAVHSMTVPEFSKLISQILSIHRSICNDIQDSNRVPDACDIWIKREVDGYIY